jgi:putative oxidoreductase
MNSNHDFAALVGRILLAALFVVSGIGKIAGFAGTAGYIASKGLPVAELLTAATIVVELGGGLAILAGWKARWAALLLAGFTIVASVLFHNFWAAPPAEAMNQQIHFMKNLSIVGGMLLLFAFGPGRFSVGRDAG